MAGQKEKRTETFGLDWFGLSDFYKTLTEDTYVLIEATITTFSFARLIRDRVKEVIIANTYELKSETKFPQLVMPGIIRTRSMRISCA
jgi:hypothetical protein